MDEEAGGSGFVDRDSGGFRSRGYCREAELVDAALELYGRGRDDLEEVDVEERLVLKL